MPARVIDEPVRLVNNKKIGFGLRRICLHPELDRKGGPGIELSIIQDMDVRVLTVEIKRLPRDSGSKLYPALQGAVVIPRAILGIPIGPPPRDHAV